MGVALHAPHAEGDHDHQAAVHAQSHLRRIWLTQQVGLVGLVGLQVSHNQNPVLKWSTQHLLKNYEGGFPQLFMVGIVV